MKRFYNYFLSLLLLLVAGVPSAMAQGFTQGDLVESIDDVSADESVLIYAPGGVSDDAPAGFLNGTNQFTETLTAACLYNLIPTGETTTGGFKTYYLKQVSTGLYIKDFDTSASNDDDAAFEMTANQSAAYKCTILQAKEIAEDATAGTDEESLRSEATSKKQDLSQSAFVFTRGDLSQLESDWEGHVFIGHVHSPFWSPYLDTNAFRIYKVNNATGKEKLQSYKEAYYGTSDPQTAYPAGNNPGSYKADVVAAAQQVYDKVDVALSADSYGLSDAETDALCDQVESSVAAVKAAFINLTPGYYYIKNVSGRYLYGKEVDGNTFLYGSASTKTISETLDADAVNYLWEVTDTRDDSTSLVSIKNVVYDLNIGGEVASVSGPDTGHGFTLAKGAKVIANITTNATALSNGYGVFSLVSQTADSNGHYGLHGKYDDTAVFGWNNATGDHNCYQFIPVEVTADDIEDAVEEAKQNVLNEKLASVCESAVTVYNKGITMEGSGEGAATNDADFSTGLVTDASQWYTNALEPNEGSLAGLTDGTFTDGELNGVSNGTMFHTQWSSGSPAAPHYLVASLTEAIDKVQFKFAKRANGNSYPITMAVWGSNDFDPANPEAATWVSQDTVSVVFKDSVTIDGVRLLSGDENASAIGILSCELDDYYKNIRFDAIKVKGNSTFWCISEGNVWSPAEISETYSNERKQINEAAPAVVEELKDALMDAGLELLANAATQETIDRLNAAVEAFNNNYPDPSRVTTALNTANTFLTSVADLVCENGQTPELGMYPYESKAALQAVLDEYADFNSVVLADINDAVNDINEALAAFKASITLPEAGVFYTIRSASLRVIPASQSGSGSQGYMGVLYNSRLYSADNGTSTVTDDNNKGNRSIKFQISKNAYTVSDPRTYPEQLDVIEDSIATSTDNRFIWFVESANEGKICFRNVGTGMYLAAKDGNIFQTAEPAELDVEAVGKATFLFNLGENANGVTQYMNANGASRTVGGWKERTDSTSYWMLQKEDFSLDENYGIGVDNVTVGNMYIGTFPLTLSPSSQYVEAYKVLGLDQENSRIVLAVAEDDIEAGTPFIYKVLEVAGEYDSDAETITGSAIFELSSDVTVLDYVMTPKEDQTLVGTIGEKTTLKSGVYLNNGNAAVANNTTIGYNSGYFNPAMPSASADDEDAAASIVLQKAALNAIVGISNAQVEIIKGNVDVYSISGQRIRTNVSAAKATNNLPAGVYIVGGKKVLVK